MVNNLRKVQFEYLEFLFKGMFSVKSKYYPDSTFFKRDDKVILELEKSGTLWVLYSVWTNISDMFSYGYEETQQLIKEWVESQLKKGVVVPYVARTNKNIKVEAQLKSEEVIPHTSITNQLMRVQEELKSAEITPLQGCVSPFSMDGEELTPQQMNYVIIGEIEEELKSEEVTPRSAIAPPFRWRNLDSVKYAEIKPNVPLSTYHLKVVEEQLKSEEIKPRQVVNGSFEWIQEQINLGEVTPTSFFVIK